MNEHEEALNQAVIIRAWAKVKREYTEVFNTWREISNIDSPEYIKAARELDRAGQALEDAEAILHGSLLRWAEANPGPGAIGG